MPSCAAVEEPGKRPPRVVATSDAPLIPEGGNGAVYGDGAIRAKLPSASTFRLPHRAASDT